MLAAYGKRYKNEQPASSKFCENCHYLLGLHGFTKHNLEHRSLQRFTHLGYLVSCTNIEEEVTIERITYIVHYTKPTIMYGFFHGTKNSWPGTTVH